MNPKTRKQTKKWRCISCGTVNDYALILIAAMLAIGSLGTVYGASTTFTWEYDDSCLVEFHSSEQADSLSKLAVLFAFIFECESEIEAPLFTPQVTIIPDDGRAWTYLKLGEVLRIGEPEETIPEVEEPVDEHPIQEPDEPKTWQERQIIRQIETLDECWTGLGAWKAYQETERIQYYLDESRQSFAIRDNLSQEIHLKRIIMAILECDAMKEYERKGLIGAYEFNKVKADEAALDYLGRLPGHPLDPLVTDQSDTMVETDPITEKDRADELEDMEAIFASKYKDPYSDCEPTEDSPDKCTNRGISKPVLTSEFDYNRYLNFKAKQVLTPEDYANTIAIAYETMCDLYFPKYNGTASELPVWLEHCL